jgi:hypothetical protein
VTRSFPSAKSAIGYAIAVQIHAAGPASRRESDAGPQPDQWAASSVFACFSRAGVNPHDAECPVLRGILAWAAHADGVDDGDTRVGSAIRRITVELVDAGLVAPPRPTLEQVGWRAVKIGDRLEIVSTTHLDAEGVALDRAELQRQVEAGEVAPLEQVAVVPDRARVRAADVETLRPLLDDGLLTVDGLDRALASLWGCSVRTARRERVRVGVTGKRGPRPQNQNMERA